jgi:hypothetical protein
MRWQHALIREQCQLCRDGFPERGIGLRAGERAKLRNGAARHDGGDDDGGGKSGRHGECREGEDKAAGYSDRRPFEGKKAIGQSDADDDVAVIGGIVGSWLWGVLKLPLIANFWVSAIVTATVGAGALLFVIKLVRR